MKFFWNKSVHENAAHYYQLAKDSKEKIAGLEKAIEETKKEIEEAKKPEKKDVKIKKQKQWFEKFHFGYTSGGLLMIGGRSAQQNDQIYAKYIEEHDLFFHADIQGGAAVILKCGTRTGPDSEIVDESELKEAAQFAACFSNAWKNGNAAVDVYCVKKNQLSKHATGGFIPSGAFAITGERKWFKDTKLSLRIGMGEIEGGGTAELEIVPEISKRKIQNTLKLVPSLAGKDKGALAKSLAKRFGVHPDIIQEMLPNGKTKTMESK
jgi:predicted ribosome quality control (RQC) complex YloA/Tae2 family protein